MARPERPHRGHGSAVFCGRCGSVCGFDFISKSQAKFNLGVCVFLFSELSDLSKKKNLLSRFSKDVAGGEQNHTSDLLSTCVSFRI